MNVCFSVVVFLLLLFVFLFLRSLVSGLLTWPDVRIGPKEASKSFGQFPLELLIITVAKIKILVLVDSHQHSNYSIQEERGKCCFGEVSCVRPWILGLGSVLEKTNQILTALILLVILQSRSLWFLQLRDFLIYVEFLTLYFNVSNFSHLSLQI